ncbi:Arc family DNA-binding protein [Ochrobactrum sp. GPK 3]
MPKIYEKGAQAADKVNVRMPDGLRDRIKGHAAARNLSSNALILETLEAAFPSPVVPESVNEKLLLATKEILVDWHSAVVAIGQDPSQNMALAKLQKIVDEAEAIK